MNKICVAGPFNTTMRSALQNAFPPEFQLQFIDSYEQFDALTDAEYIILRTLCLDKNAIMSLKRTKLIQRWGAGYDSVDIEVAGSRGIRVAITAGMNAVPVAELTLALTLAVYRNLIPLTNSIQSGAWEREAYAKRSYTLNGKTVGVFGIGNIGRAVSALYNSFGSKVDYTDTNRLPVQEEKRLNVSFVCLDDLLQCSDIITLHSPLTEETRGIINEKTISMMKDGAVLINTARQELVDLPSLAVALRSGKLLGAGIDAIEESIVHEKIFSGIDTVVFSPHLGGNTIDNAEHMANRCAQQIMAVARGDELQPPHLVNGQYLKTGEALYDERKNNC